MLLLLQLVPLLIPIWVLLWHRQRRQLPNGPLGLPFFGNFFDLRGQVLHKQLTRWSDKYGDVFSYMIGHRPVVVLSSPESLEELCVKRGNIYSSRPRTSKQADICTRNARIVNMVYDDKWRKHRRLIHGLLGMHYSKTFMPYQAYESVCTLQSLLSQPELFYTEMGRYSGSVTFSLLLGSRLDQANHKIPQRISFEMERFFNHIRPGVWLVDWMPVLDRLPDFLAPWREKARQFHLDHMRFWRIFYTHMRERVIEGTAPECFISKFLEQAEAKEFDDDECATIVAELLTAGTETTATTLQWFFKAATLYPNFVARAYEELDQVVGQDRMPGWEDEGRLPYISCTITELHRWASASPLAFNHATISTDVYNGKIIPQGTTIIPNTYAIHHNPELFADHESFAPERFLPPDHPWHYPNAAKLKRHYSFGIGRRECPGQHVANSSLFIIISRLLWAFDIGPKSHADIPTGTVGNYPVLGPQPFECTIKPRNDKLAELIQRELSDSSTVQVEDSTVYEELLMEFD